MHFFASNRTTIDFPRTSSILLIFEFYPRLGRRTRKKTCVNPPGASRPKEVEGGPASSFSPPPGSSRRALGGPQCQFASSRHFSLEQRSLAEMTSATTVGCCRVATKVPPSISFNQPLRGFENLTLNRTQVVAGEAEYTYPFIIDEGSLTTLYLLPTFFFRQIDFDLFFTSASLLDDTEVAMAVGAALDFKMNLWSLPVDLTFQESRRLSHDEEWAFYFGFGSAL